MKVLKLCTSDEKTGDLPDSVRAYRVTERLLRERLGEEVEVAIQPVWPNKRLPALIERWVEEQQPDVVLFIINPFWTTFESVPLALQRRYGWLGRKLGNTIRGVGSNEGTRGSWWVSLARGASVRLIRGVYEFEPEEVAEVLDESLRKILTKESREVIVRGPLGPLGYHGSKRTMARAERRQQRTDEAVAAVCRKYHVHFLRRGEVDFTVREEGLQSDGVHSSTEAHWQRGVLEGHAIAEVWLAAQGVRQT